jgi:hypothetical protein
MLKDLSNMFFLENFFTIVFIFFNGLAGLYTTALTFYATFFLPGSIGSKGGGSGSSSRS